MTAAQCIPFASAASDPDSRAVSGERLAAGLRRFVVDEEIATEDGDLFEEVAAVIEGAFHVVAAGEAYDLSVGEGIIIPPGEPRRWRCTVAPGLLYQVHAHRDAKA